MVILRIWHSLFFSLQLRVLGDRYESEYGWITFRLVALVCVFHLMSLACLLPRVFVLISWLDTSFHFVDIYLMLRDMFIDHDHLVFTLYTYHKPDTSFFV